MWLLCSLLMSVNDSQIPTECEHFRDYSFIQKLWSGLLYHKILRLSGVTIEDSQDLRSNLF